MNSRELGSFHPPIQPPSRGSTEAIGPSNLKPQPSMASDSQRLAHGGWVALAKGRLILPMEPVTRGCTRKPGTLPDTQGNHKVYRRCLASPVSVAKLGGSQENSPPQPRRGCGAQCHRGGLILEIPLLARALPSGSNHPAAGCGRGFPSLSKEGNLPEPSKAVILLHENPGFIQPISIPWIHRRSIRQ